MSSPLPPCAWCADDLPENGCPVCKGSRALVGEKEQVVGIALGAGWSTDLARAFVMKFGQLHATAAALFALRHGLASPEFVDLNVATGELFALRPVPTHAEAVASGRPMPAACGQCNGAGVVETLDGAQACACQRAIALRARASSAALQALATPTGLQRAVMITLLVDAQPTAAQMLGAAHVAAAYLNQTQQKAQQPRVPDSGPDHLKGY